jgi:hypothetical protein
LYWIGAAEFIKGTVVVELTKLVVSWNECLLASVHFVRWRM